MVAAGIVVASAGASPTVTSQVGGRIAAGGITVRATGNGSATANGTPAAGGLAAITDDQADVTVAPQTTAKVDNNANLQSLGTVDMPT